MKKIILTLVAPLLAIGILPLAQASTSITKMTVSANGANERSGSGAKTGSASGTITVNTTQNTMCFTNMKTKGLVNVTAAHVHLDTLGFDGSIFVNFAISDFNRVG